MFLLLDLEQQYRCMGYDTKEELKQAQRLTVSLKLNPREWMLYASVIIKWYGNQQKVAFC